MEINPYQSPSTTSSYKKNHRLRSLILGLPAAVLLGLGLPTGCILLYNSSPPKQPSSIKDSANNNTNSEESKSNIETLKLLHKKITT